MDDNSLITIYAFNIENTSNKVMYEQQFQN